MKEVITVNDFWGNIPTDCKEAIRELKRLKVHRLAGYDWEQNFSEVWWCILHEVDLYADGEYRAEDEPSERKYRLNLAQAQSADRWLVKWLPLFNKYKTPDFCGDRDFTYTGQVI